MASPLLPGAEPFSAIGGEDGVLVLHGFTGTPQSVRPLADALARSGLSVELPLLPGHGTAIEDMLALRFDDWTAAVEEAFDALAGRCRRIGVAGLSMGGTLACWLATRHELAGAVLVNPLVEPAAPSFLEVLRGMLAAGTEVIPGIGSDIARPAAGELAYEGTPVAPLLSLFEGVERLAGGLGRISCPVLLFTSRQDHVVPPSNGDFLAGRVAGRLERVWLEKSYHVATLDYDAGEVESRTLSFFEEVFGA